MQKTENEDFTFNFNYVKSDSCIPYNLLGGFPGIDMEGVLTRNGQSRLVAYHGNGATDMTSWVELFFSCLFIF